MHARKQKQQNSTRLAQTTIGLNRDIRVDKKPDGRIELVEVIFTPADIEVKPLYTPKLLLSVDGISRLVNVLNSVLDNLQGVKDAPDLPIDDSDYMRRGFREETNVK